MICLTAKYCTIICLMLSNFLFILLQTFLGKYAISTQVLFIPTYGFHRSGVLLHQYKNACNTTSISHRDHWHFHCDQLFLLKSRIFICVTF